MTARGGERGGGLGGVQAPDLSPSPLESSTVALVGVLAAGAPAGSWSQGLLPL